MQDKDDEHKPHQMNVPGAFYAFIKAKADAMGVGWATFIRDNVFDPYMIRELQSGNSSAPVEVSVTPPSYESRWAAMGCEDDPFDLYWMEAKHAFIDKQGDEETALRWMERGIRERNIQKPRAFIISWYNRIQTMMDDD